MYVGPETLSQTITASVLLTRLVSMPLSNLSFADCSDMLGSKEFQNKHSVCRKKWECNWIDQQCKYQIKNQSASRKKYVPKEYNIALLKLTCLHAC